MLTYDELMNGQYMITPENFKLLVEQGLVNKVLVDCLQPVKIDGKEYYHIYMKYLTYIILEKI